MSGKVNIKAAVILAAGNGVRMNDDQDIDFSKPMVKVLGKPLVSYIIDSIIVAGIKKIVIIKRKNDIQIENIVEFYKNHDIEFAFVVDEVGNGSLNSFAFAEGEVDYPFLLTDCDIICKKSNLLSMINSVCNMESDHPFGYVSIVDNPISISEKMMQIDVGRVIGFNKSGIIGGVCGGMIYLFYKNPFAYSKKLINEGVTSYAKFFNYLATNERILVMHTTDMWDVDTVADIQLTVNLLSEAN